MPAEPDQTHMTRTDLLGAWSIPTIFGTFLVGTTSLFSHLQHGIYNTKRLYETWAFLAVMLATAAFPAMRRAFCTQLSLVPRWVVNAFLAAFLLAIVSSLRFEHPGYSLAEPALLALLLLSVLSVAASRRVIGPAFDRAALIIIALLGAVVAIQEAMGFLANWSMDKEFSYDQMAMAFAHPRFYNQLQSWTLPILAGLPLLFRRTRAMIGLAVGLLALQWCILLVSGGRGTFLSVIISLVVIAIFTRKVVRQWLGIHLAGFIAGALLFGAIVGSQPALAPDGGDLLEESVQRPMLHTTGRSSLWHAALEQARHDPWLGSGPARYSCFAPSQFAAHPHNFVLQTLAEWGLPATMLMVASGLWLGILLLRRTAIMGRSPYPFGHVLLPLIAAGIFAAALHANLSGVLMTPSSQVLGALILGWAAGLSGENSAISPCPQLRKGLIALLSGIAIALALMGFAALEVNQLHERLEHSERGYSEAPRFWQSGHICGYSYHDSEG